MENKEAIFKPELEIVKFGPFDFLQKSLDENEPDLLPGGSLMG